MTIISSEAYLSKYTANPKNNTYLNKEADFSGMVVYHNLDGSYNTAGSFNKKEDIISKLGSLKNENPNKISQATPDCLEFPLYEVFGSGCIELDNNHIYCEYMYSVEVGTITVCPNGVGQTPVAPGSSTNMINAEDPRENYELLNLVDSVNLNKLFKCFDNVPDQGAVYSVKLCADLPVNNNVNSLLDSYLQPGHTFIMMTKTSGNVSVSQSFGFYPQSAFRAAFHIPVTSQINNNKGHEYNASYEMNNITAGQFEILIDSAYSLKKHKYSMSTYNCTDYALDVFNSIRSNPLQAESWIPGITPGTSGLPLIQPFNYGSTPNALYNLIKQMKSNGDTNAKTVIGSGFGTEPCN